VSAINMYPGYDSTTVDGDICKLTLSTPVPASRARSIGLDARKTHTTGESTALREQAASLCAQSLR
jgi:hypothetical protein